MTKDKVLKYLWIAVFAGVVLYFGVYVYQIVKILSTSLPLEYGDGWNAYVANWWGNGGLSHIYSPKGEIPYVNMPYTPIYYLVVGFFYKFTGPVFWIARVVSILCGLGCAGLFFLIVRKLSGSKWWGLVAAVLFYMPPITRSWTFWFKNETMALFFSVLALFLVVKFNGTKKVLWAVIPVLLAIFTKQTFISAGVAIGLYLLVTNWRTALQYAGLVLLGGLSLVGLLQWATGGTFISAVLTGPTMMPTFWQLSLYLMMLIVNGQKILIILAVCAVVLLVRQGKMRTLPALFVFYFASATTICAVISSKTGGWLPYSIEMIPAAVMLVVILAVIFSKINIPFSKYSSIPKFVVPVLLLIQLFTMTSYFSWGKPYLTSTDYKVMYSALAEVPKDVPVMSEVEDVMLNTGRDPISEPSFFSQLASKGQIDISPVIDMVKEKKIGLIIQEWNIDEYWEPPRGSFPTWMPSRVSDYYKIGILRSTGEMATAIKDNYQLKAQSGSIWIYEPKP